MADRFERYPALEGLRAWLAWAVLASHVMQASELYAVSRAAAWLFDFGERAVEVFIILSGFVVTHLLLSKPATYTDYLRRRAFRLLPAFIVACIVGYFAVAAAAHAMAGAPASSEWAAHVRELAATQTEHLVAHALLHLTMLHGLVPNTLLPLSEYAFTPPGWSLSLEWQFYLIAPAIVVLWQRRHGPWIVLAAAFAMYAGYQALEAANPDLWNNPSVLPGAAPWFAIGIASRFAATRMRERVTRPALVAAAGFVLFTALGFIALGIWVAMLAILWARREGAGLLDRGALALADGALQSPFALYFGARSYSLYLIHMPLLMFAGAAQHGLIGMEPHEKALRLALVVVPAAIVAAHLMYAFIERPMITLGAGRSPRVRAAAA